MLQRGETLQAHSYGNGNFIDGIPIDDVEVCFSLHKIHDTLDIHIHNVDLFQWLYKINSLREGFYFNGTIGSISMDLLLPCYHEVREKFNKDRSQDLCFNALELFVLHFLRDRSIFAIFGLDELYQAGILTETHFRDLDSWDWFIFKDLDCLDDMVDELDERGELDDLEVLDEPGGPDELDGLDQDEPCDPVALKDEIPLSEVLTSVRGCHKTPLSELQALVRAYWKRQTPLSALLASVKICDEEFMDRVLRKNPRIVNAEILCAAIPYYNPTIFNRLLGQCTQVNYGHSRHVPLCMAAEHGNLGAVKLLMARGADPEQTSTMFPSQTPLAHAAYQGHFEIVRYLIEEQGADIHGSLSCRPLWCAIQNGHTQIVDYLLASGADVFHGSLPLFSGRSTVGALEAPDYRDKFERLIPNCCARTRFILLSKAAADGYLDLVEYITSFGVDVNSVTKESPLYHATKNRRSDVVRFLLGHVTNIRPADVSNLLWCAAENDAIDIVYLLLGCGPQLYPTLLNKLLSVAAECSDRYQSEAYGNAHDGISMCLPEDGSFAEWDSWVSDRL